MKLIGVIENIADISFQEWGDAHRGGLGEVVGGVFGIAPQKLCLQGRPHGRERGLIVPFFEGRLCTAIEGERSQGLLCKGGHAMGLPLLGAFTGVAQGIGTAF
jgi:hypothetical protein